MVDPFRIRPQCKNKKNNFNSAFLQFSEGNGNFDGFLLHRYRTYQYLTQSCKNQKAASDSSGQQSVSRPGGKPKKVLYAHTVTGGRDRDSAGACLCHCSQFLGIEGYCYSAGKYGARYQ